MSANLETKPLTDYTMRQRNITAKLLCCLFLATIPVFVMAQSQVVKGVLKAAGRYGIKSVIEQDTRFKQSVTTLNKVPNTLPPSQINRQSVIDKDNNDSFSVLRAHPLPTRSVEEMLSQYANKRAEDSREYFSMFYEGKYSYPVESGYFHIPDLMEDNTNNRLNSFFFHVDSIAGWKKQPLEK